ncbi:hypothetical protein LX36DRAFT_230317 [Colletotrichum falcatum]|nr:hypothetical protein LX36DRAFT_230317 [Colletotrichum falcatum]
MVVGVRAGIKPASSGSVPAAAACGHVGDAAKAVGIQRLGPWLAETAPVVVPTRRREKTPSRRSLVWRVSGSKECHHALRRRHDLPIDAMRCDIRPCSSSQQAL